MEHLFSSTVKVQRLAKQNVNGMTQTGWSDVSSIGAFRCRLDLNFLRPGKDLPPAYEAGKAPDRIGILFCNATVPLRAGDRIVTVSGPVTGVFDIRAIPDIATDYSSGHHIEVQIIESVQKNEPPRTF